MRSRRPGAGRVFAFDAYGTLLDVHSAVARAAGHLGEDGAALSDLWRRRQLEYTWVRTLCGRYRDFWAITEEALDFSLESFGFEDPDLRTRLLDAYATLRPYPDAAEALQHLRARGNRIAVLSNANGSMLERAFQAGGLMGLVGELVSADAVGAFKTHPSVYALPSRVLDVDRRDLSFVSSNRWDVAGAAAAGLRTIWVNRGDAVDEYRDLAPDFVIESLAELRDL